MLFRSLKKKKNLPEHSFLTPLQHQEAQLKHSFSQGISLAFWQISSATVQQDQASSRLADIARQSSPPLRGDRRAQKIMQLKQ